MLEDEDMIVDRDDEGAPAGTPPADDNPPADPPAATPPADAELDGILIDNDEPPAPVDPPADPDPDADPDAGNEEEETLPADTPADKPEVPAAPEVPPTPPAQDPGTEFVPQGDYAFDIEYLVDGESHTLRVTKPEDMEQLPATAQFTSPKQMFDVQAKFNAMTLGIDQERRDWEANKERFESEQAQAQELETRVQNSIAEMNYLSEKGKLPPLDPKFEDADWSDPEVQKDPGVKARWDLIQFRAQENQVRAKAGLGPMSMIEAQMTMQQEQADKAAAEQKAKDAAARKARGAMVDGPTPTPVSSIPDDMIVGEGGSIRDLDRI